MKINQFALAALATVLTVGSLAAQQTQPLVTQQPQPQANQGRSVADDSQSKDQTFAKVLMIANQEQVQLSQFAQEKATHEDVKAFAAMLVKDHQSNLEQLKSVLSQSATTANAANPRSSGTTATNPRGTSTDATSPNYTQTANKGSQVDFVQLHQEIATQCLKDSKEMLSSKDGSEFDKCFVGMQVVKHGGAISMLTVLERHATGKTQELIKSELEANTKHMESAVSLMEKLADKVSSKSDRKSK